MSNITAIATQTGQYKVNQYQVAAFLGAHFSDQTMARKYRLLARENSISQKHTIIPDFDISCENPLLYHPKKALPSTAERMAVYAREALKMAEVVANEALLRAHESAQNITHIITISCTGLSAPGLDCMLVDALGLSPNIQRHTVNFMGCYAAFHGLRLADMICKTDTHARVLMVSVELCSLHFTGKNNDDNLLSTYLFSDGAAACIITNKIPANGRFLRLDDFESVLLSEGKNDMAWQVGNHGFEMVLSSQVPQHVENNIALAVDKLLYKNELSRAQMAHYAIHPGGKSILKGFGRALQIEDEVLAESYKVLFEHGNMSSATIMFVLKEILENNQKSPGHIYAAAFGPGLTIESGLFSLQTTEQPKVNVAHQLNLA